MLADPIFGNVYADDKTYVFSDFTVNLDATYPTINPASIDCGLLEYFISGEPDWISLDTNTGNNFVLETSTTDTTDATHEPLGTPGSFQLSVSLVSWDSTVTDPDDPPSYD